MVLDLGRGSRRRYVLQQGDNCTTRVGTRVEVGGGWRVVAIDVLLGSMSEVMVPPPCRGEPQISPNNFRNFWIHEVLTS